MNYSMDKNYHICSFGIRNDAHISYLQNKDISSDFIFGGERGGGGVKTNDVCAKQATMHLNHKLLS